MDVGYAALADANAAGLGVHLAGRLSLRFSVAYELTGSTITTMNHSVEYTKRG